MTTPVGKVLHNCRVQLTREQAKEIKALWNGKGCSNGMVLMQPVINLGPFDLTNCFLNTFVLDSDCRAQIIAVIESASANRKSQIRKAAR